jgi:hypothetical protein
MMFLEKRGFMRKRYLLLGGILLGCFMLASIAYGQNKPAQKVMPNVVGMSLEKADAELRKIGIARYSLQATVTTQDPRENKRVRAQSPAPGKPLGPVVLDCYRYVQPIAPDPSVSQSSLEQAKQEAYVGKGNLLPPTDPASAPKLTPQKK